MCKAGFAGDDAPRAVFRESHPRILAVIELLLLELQPADTFCSVHCRQTSSSWVWPQFTALGLWI